MKRIIDIPEEVYNDVINDGVLYINDIPILKDSIENSTSLGSLVYDIKAEMQEKIDKAIEEMNRLADHKIRPISFDQSVAIDMCIDILKKYIRKEEKDGNN